MSQTYTFPTVSTVKSQSIAETIGSTTSSLTALQDDNLNRFIDVINREFVNAAHTMSHNGAWTWMQDVTNFETVDETTLNGAVASGASSVTLTDSSNFGSTGRGWARTSSNAVDFIDWSANAANVLTTSDVDMAHADGEAFGTLYGVPSDLAKVRKLVVNSTEYKYLEQDLLPINLTYYTRGAYFVLPEGVGAQDVTVWYEKSPTDLYSGVVATDDAKSLDIPEDFMWYAIHKLNAHIHRIRRREELAANELQMAQMELEKALGYDINRTTPQGIFPDY